MLAPLSLKPGVVLDDTRLAATGYAVSSDKVRWVRGAAQSQGGWEQATDARVPGICRALHAWADNTGERYLALGTHRRLLVYHGGDLYNVTPARAVGALATDPFSVTAGSAMITVVHASHGAITGDTVYLAGANAVGGITPGGPSGVCDGGAGPPSNPFSTTAGSKLVIVRHPAHGMATWDMVTLTAAGATGGIPATDIDQTHIIDVIDSDHYCFWAATAATSTVTATDAEPVAGGGGGGTPTFSFWRAYTVESVFSANSYTITHPSLATLSTNGGGPAVNALYEIGIGSTDSTERAGYGTGRYGEGAYGTSASQPVDDYQLRVWSLANWGEFLLANPSGGTIYEWTLGLSRRAVAIGRAVLGRPDIRAPLRCATALVSPERHLLALGCDPLAVTDRPFEADPNSNILTSPAHGLADGTAVLVKTQGWLPAPLSARTVYYIRDAGSDIFRLAATAGGSAIDLTDGGAGAHDVELAAPDALPLDPMLVRWSSGQDNTDWVPRLDNGAGDIRLADGSRIVGGINTRGGILVWTDDALYLLRYTGSTESIYSYDLLGTGCGLAGPNAMIEQDGIAYWLSPGGQPYAYGGGSPRPLPCPVQQWLAGRLAASQGHKIYAFFDAAFPAVTWLFPTLPSSECTAYVRLDLQEAAGDPNAGWSVGTWDRTAWIDRGLFPRPLAVSADGQLYWHDVGSGDNGQAVSRHVEWAPVQIRAGDHVVNVSRLVFDAVIESGSLQIYLSGRRWPAGDAQVKGPYSVTPHTQRVDLRMQARQVGARIESASADDAWRLGVVRLDISEGPRR